MTKHWKFLKPPKRNTEKIQEDIYTVKVGWKCSPVFGRNQIKEIQLIMCLKLFLIISILPMPSLDTEYLIINWFFHPCVQILLEQLKKFTIHLIARTFTVQQLTTVHSPKRS